MRTFILGLLLLSVPISASDTVFWTFGPMLHWNFGNGGHELSYGLEASLWTPVNLPKPGFAEKEDPLVGFDLGLELQGKKTRIYSEAQYGLIMPSNYAGASAGPYLELQPGRSPDFGIQGSLWGSPMILGVDLRGRVGTSGAEFSPGLFGKVGYCWNGGCEL